MLLFAVLLLAYLIGSIPFGLILTRLAGLGDIRAIGSGNIGATNVLRTGNKKLAALTLLLDGGKGYVAVYAVSYCSYFLNVHNILAFDGVILYAPLAAVIGHVFPLWLRFKGGKGVATAFGGFIAFDIAFGVHMGETMLIVWIIIFLAFRYSSLASLVSLWLVSLGYITAYFSDSWDRNVVLAITVPVSLLITYRHKDNIRRLLAGTEPKFGKKP